MKGNNFDLCILPDGNTAFSYGGSSLISSRSWWVYAPLWVPLGRRLCSPTPKDTEEPLVEEEQEETDDGEDGEGVVQGVGSRRKEDVRGAAWGGVENKVVGVSIFNPEEVAILSQELELGGLSKYLSDISLLGAEFDGPTGSFSKMLVAYTTEEQELEDDKDVLQTDSQLIIKGIDPVNWFFKIVLGMAWGMNVNWEPTGEDDLPLLDDSEVPGKIVK